MPNGVFLVNGIRISYHLIEAAIKWALQNNGSLTGVYVYSDEKNAESYGFPSDIEKVETEVSENEGEAELDTLIRHNIAYAEKQCANSKVSISTFQLKNPDITTIGSHLAAADIIWLDPDTYKEEAASDIVDISLDDILASTTAEIIPLSQ